MSNIQIEKNKQGRAVLLDVKGLCIHKIGAMLIT
jgi:hypothetical protein